MSHFCRCFWVPIKTTKINLKSDSLSLFCRFFCRFFAFFSNFLWFSDLKIFLFGRNPLTFVRLRTFLPDVTQLTHHQHDDSMPIISFLVFVYFKVQKKLLFLFQKPTKKRQKKRQKSDKTPTNTLIKTGNSKKATVVVIYFGLSVPTPGEYCLYLFGTSTAVISDMLSNRARE